MKNLSRNTAAVLVITLFTGLAVFSAIQLGGRLFGTSEAGAQTAASSAQTQSEGGESDDESGSGYGNGYGQSGSGYDQSGSEQYADPYGQSGSSSGSAGGTTQTCPATGCSASTCHATQ
jgi:hypothetical protein